MNTDSDPTRDAVRASLRVLGDAAGPAPTFERLTLPTEPETVGAAADRRSRRMLISGLAAASVAVVAVVGWQVLDIGDRDPRVETQPSVTAPPSAAGPTSPTPTSAVEPTTPRVADPASGWSQLPAAPLSPRTRPTAVWNGEEVFVIGGGGENMMCPPNARCAVVSDPDVFSDGAAYNPATETWRRIADAPVPVLDGIGVALGGDLYVAVRCANPVAYCGASLLRYRPRADEWTMLDAPLRGFGEQLVPAGRMLLSISPTDDAGERSGYYVFDVRTENWTELPDDPLDLSYDQQAVWHNGSLFIFAKPIDAEGDEGGDIQGARYDLRSGEWEVLAPSDTSGYKAWLVDGTVVINPHFSADTGGGVYEPSSDTWSPLPAVPTDDWSGDMVGVLGENSASFGKSGGGFVLDVTSNQWVWVVDRTGTRRRFNEAMTAVGRSLFTFGGERWNQYGSEGELLDEAWMWTPPGIFDGLDMRLELAKTTVQPGGTIRSRLDIENNTGSTVTDPGCVIPSGRWGLIPADEPNTELEWSVEIDCGGPFEMPDGFSDQWSGPDFAARTLTGEPLEPGEYLAALEIDGRTERLTVPVTIE